MKRIYNINTDSWSFPDGSGVETREWLLRKSLIELSSIINGIEGNRNFKKEYEEVNKLLRDRDELNNNK